MLTPIYASHRFRHRSLAALETKIQAAQESYDAFVEARSELGDTKRTEEKPGCKFGMPPLIHKRSPCLFIKERALAMQELTRVDNIYIYIAFMTCDVENKRQKQ